MSAIQRLLYLLCPLILFLMGAANLLRRFGLQAWRQWIDQQLAYFPTISIAAWWALLIVIPVFMCLIAVRRTFSRGVLVFQTESGRPLRIRQSAVNRFIHDRLMALPFIRAAQVRSKSRGGSLALSIRAWVLADDSLDSFQDRIVARATKDAQTSFGVARVLEPDIQFEEIASDKNKVKAESGSSSFAPAASTALAKEPAAGSYEFRSSEAPQSDAPKSDSSHE